MSHEDRDAFASSSVPAMSSSYKIPIITQRPKEPDQTDWMSSSCGEKPHVTDDIRSWRHFRSRIRNGEVEDHLQKGMSRSVATEGAGSDKLFGKFYFNAEKKKPGESGTGAGKASAISQSLPVGYGIRAPGAPIGIQVDLPTLSVTVSPAKESADSAEKQPASGGRHSIGGDDSIFDLEM